MSRQRDYQPTIDRARRQAEDGQRLVAKLRAKADRMHGDLMRAQTAERIATEEADHLREEVVILESIVRDLKQQRREAFDAMRAVRADLEAQLAAAQPVRTLWRRVKAWAHLVWTEGVTT